VQHEEVQRLCLVQPGTEPQQVPSNFSKLKNLENLALFAKFSHNLFPMAAPNPISETQQRFIDKWSRFKRDASQLISMKRSMDERFCEEMQEVLQLQFGESKHGDNWKRRLKDIQENNVGAIEEFAGQFFRKELDWPKRKQPLQLLNPAANRRRVDGDNEGSELTEG